MSHAISKERQVCYPLFGEAWTSVGVFWPDNSKEARDEQLMGFGKCSWNQIQRLMIAVCSLLAEPTNINELRHGGPRIHSCLRYPPSGKAGFLWMHWKLMDLVKQLIQNTAIQQLSSLTQLSLSAISFDNQLDRSHNRLAAWTAPH